jgi:uncharacterized protein (TIGR03437 family)
MKTARIATLFSLCLVAAPAFAQTITGSCTPSNLNGTYSMTLSGRAISTAGSFAGSIQGVGAMSFNGSGGVTGTGTLNTNLAQGQSFTFTGTYTVQSNCLVAINLSTGFSATFAAVVWSNGTQITFTGADSTYVYSGSATNVEPVCATPTLSGEYGYEASGYTLSGTAQNGSGDESGIMQFDGQGHVTSSYTITSTGGNSSALTATGTYSIGANCLATGTLTDSTGKTNTFAFSIRSAYGQNAVLIESNPQFVRSGATHSAFLNPTQSIGNVASYALNATPAGSVFAIFGTGFAGANKTASATSTPLPTELLTTQVKVNGELAPLFYVDSGDIDAQMPWDIPGGTVASVIVYDGGVASNAAAIYVPAGATPGISFYSSNRAVVVNANGSTNSSSAGASVGDEVVAYFTGGGPVNAAGKLTTGSPAPAGLSPVVGSTAVTVGGIASPNVPYIGLTPGSIGLYQANFTIPQIAKGTYTLVITIGGQANIVGSGISQPVITITN